MDVARAGVAAAGTGGTPCSAAVVAPRNAEAASYGAALPWSPPGTASPSTAAVAAVAVVAVDSVPVAVAVAVRNQNRWFASSLFSFSLCMWRGSVN